MNPPGKKTIPLMMPQAFEAQVRDHARFGHMVRILDHVTEDRADRRITRPMILRTLRQGQVAEKPRWDADRGV